MRHGADLFFRLRGLGPLEQVDVVWMTLLSYPMRVEASQRRRKAVEAKNGRGLKTATRGAEITPSDLVTSSEARTESR
jgi:hypothetical protein